MDIGQRIKQLRESKGFTQEQLAHSIYKSVSSIKKYESGEISISVSTAIDICNALGTSILYILVDDPSEILHLIKEYYNLEDKQHYNIEKDFEMVMRGFVERYKK